MRSPASRGAAGLRADPSGIDGQGVGEVVDHYAAIISALDTPPILMGHSFGGAVVQVPLSPGFGAAGFALHSAPVKGVYSVPWSTLR